MDFDINSLNELLSTADETFGAADRALGNVEKAGSIIKRIKGFLSTPESAGNADIKAAVADLTNEIADAKLANADLKIKLATIQQTLLEAQQRQSKLDRYVMTETPAGTYVYALKDIETGTEPAHFACPNCFVEDTISILQGDGDIRQCFKCNMPIRFKHSSPRPPLNIGRAKRT